MLTLVMKYDLRNCFRRALSLISAFLVISVFALGLLYFALSLGESPVSLVFSTLCGLAVLTMAVVLFILLSLGVLCYYRSLFTDEGYLSMSIPMKTSRLVNAKILSVIVYECVILLLGAIAFLVATVLPLGLYDPEMLFSFSKVLLSSLISGIKVSPWSIILSSLGFFVEIIAQTVMLLSAITIGSVLASRHRVPLSLGIFLGANAALGTTEIIAGYITEAVVSDAYFSLILPLLCEVILTVIFCILIYIISMRLMVKRFNIS